jgi:DUF4097 and DUF4098 domain-containing protein YvlB
LLLLGLLLIAIGLSLALPGSREAAIDWLMKLWPVFLICAGVIRVMGFAVERKPRSPLGGTLLIAAGVLFLAGRLHADLNVLQVYGRYWPALLVLYGSVELIRFYTHRHTDRSPARALTVGRALVIITIILTGVVANRLATNPSVLSALRLPDFLSSLRDAVVGKSFVFTDEPFIASGLSAGTKISINNRFGNVRVKGGGERLSVTLSKSIRAWDEKDAAKTAREIRLQVDRSGDGLFISTNREQSSEQFTTDLDIEMPSEVALVLTGGHGSMSAESVTGLVEIKARHSDVALKKITGPVNLDLSYSNAAIEDVTGNIEMKGAKRVSLINITGEVDLAASNGTVELRQISGEARVNAPFCSIIAEGLGAPSLLKTEHARVQVRRTVDLEIKAPHSEISASEVAGNLEIESSHRRVNVADIAGELRISGKHSTIAAERLGGPADISTSHGEVIIKDFNDAVSVETSYRDVALESLAAPEADIRVKNAHGAIRLVLPRASQFQLDAASDNGRVLPIGFEGSAESSGGSLLSGRGSNGPTIKLKTSYKDIVITAAGARQTQANGRVN